MCVFGCSVCFRFLFPLFCCVGCASTHVRRRRSRYKCPKSSIVAFKYINFNLFAFNSIVPISTGSEDKRHNNSIIISIYYCFDVDHMATAERSWTKAAYFHRNNSDMNSICALSESICALIKLSNTHTHNSVAAFTSAWALELRVVCNDIVLWVVSLRNYVVCNAMNKCTTMIVPSFPLSSIFSLSLARWTTCN